MERERKKTWWFLASPCSAGYLWRGSIRPFVLCGQQRRRRKGEDSGKPSIQTEAPAPHPPSTSPPPKTPNMPRILEDGLPVPLAFTLSGTNQRFYIHTQETNAVLTGIPDLSAPLTHLIVAEQTLLRQLTYFLASFDCTAQHISLFFSPSLSLFTLFLVSYSHILHGFNPPAVIPACACFLQLILQIQTKAQLCPGV